MHDRHEKMAKTAEILEARTHSILVTRWKNEHTAIIKLQTELKSLKSMHELIAKTKERVMVLLSMR